MAYGKPEQIDEMIYISERGRKKTTSSPGFRKELKKQAKRRRRILEKRFLDEAPTKNEYHGWSL